MMEDELDAIRRHREEAHEIVRESIHLVPFEDILLQQIRSPWAGTVQYATMLSCTRLGHPTRFPDDPPEARCVCNWRKGA